MSTRSGASGSASGRQTLPDKKPDRSTGGEPPSPDSPIRSAGPLTRKRAASLRTEGPRIEDLSLNTPTTDRSPPPPPPHLPESGRDLICLCTPAPKVPRPRNGMLSFSQCPDFFPISQSLFRISTNKRAFGYYILRLCFPATFLVLLPHPGHSSIYHTNKIGERGSISWLADIRDTLPTLTLILTLLSSLYPLPPTSSSPGRSPESRARQPRNLKDHWREVARGVRGAQGAVEATR